VAGEVESDVDADLGLDRDLGHVSLRNEIAAMSHLFHVHHHRSSARGKGRI
jgi:hypothetical protein